MGDHYYTNDTSPIHRSPLIGYENSHDPTFSGSKVLSKQVS